MARRISLTLITVGFLLAACGSSTSSSPAGTSVASVAASAASVPSATASASVVPSAVPVASGTADVVVGGDRPVTVHVPPGYDARHPAPLLIALHHYGGSGMEQETYFNLGELAKQRGYLYALPDGTLNSSGIQFWDATDACCDFDRSGVDDVGYLARVINEIRASFAVDPKRIDLIGHSNGGFMVYAMACAHADQIAAIISLAGATFGTLAKCAPSVPVAVLQIHGTADDQVAFDGGTVQPGEVQGLGSAQAQTMAAYPGAESSVAAWATYDGCAAKMVLDQRLDIDADLFYAGKPAETSVTRWTGCRRGGAVELWTMTGGGHVPTLSDSFPRAAMDFFEAHPKP